MLRLKLLTLSAMTVVILLTVAPGYSQEADPAMTSDQTTYIQEGIWKREADGNTHTYYIETVDTGRTEDSAPKKIVLVHRTADEASSTYRLGYIVPGTNTMFLSSSRGFPEVSVGICHIEDSKSFVRYAFGTDHDGETVNTLGRISYWKHLD